MFVVLWECDVKPVAKNNSKKSMAPAVTGLSVSSRPQPLWNLGVPRHRSPSRVSQHRLLALL